MRAHISDAFCKALPKVELHAHLNGSISESTLRKLVAHFEERFGKTPEKFEPLPSNLEEAIARMSQMRTLTECFDIFNIVHKVTKDATALKIITHDVIKEFAEDGVRYLELRTTPKDLPAGVSKRDYVETVLQAMGEAARQYGIEVRLILSVDRRNGLADALDTVGLAAQYQDRGVVGVDFSGNPEIGHARDYVQAWALARQHGLQLTIHFAEIDNPDENHYIIHELRPGRIGHGTCVNDELEKDMLENPIPLEICMTSNVLCQTVDSHDTHHFHDLYVKGYPCIICTDDKGVFCTTLSQEYLMSSRKLGLNRKQLWNLSFTAIDYTFAPDDVKEQLRRQWQEDKERVMSVN